MRKITTMFASDRTTIRIVASLLNLAVNHLDGICDGGNQSAVRDSLTDCIRQIKDVMATLDRLHIQAVTYQLPPGKETPNF